MNDMEELATMAKVRIASPFGEWLRNTREAKRWTQEELARKANDICTGAYISALERGQDVGKKGKPTRPSEEIVVALATALGANIPKVLRLAGYNAAGMPDPAADMMDQIAEQAAEMVRRFLDLPADRRKEALNIMRVLNPDEVQIVRGDELDKEDDMTTT